MDAPKEGGAMEGGAMEGGGMEVAKEAGGTDAGTTVDTAVDMAPATDAEETDGGGQ
jgi:hypothetical protein